MMLGTTNTQHCIVYYGLFNDAVSGARKYAGSNIRTSNEWRCGKDVEGKCVA